MEKFMGVEDPPTQKIKDINLNSQPQLSVNPSGTAAAKIGEGAEKGWCGGHRAGWHFPPHSCPWGCQGRIQPGMRGWDLGAPGTRGRL